MQVHSAKLELGSLAIGLSLLSASPRSPPAALGPLLLPLGGLFLFVCSYRYIRKYKDHLNIKMNNKRYLNYRTAWYPRVYWYDTGTWYV